MSKKDTDRIAAAILDIHDGYDELVPIIQEFMIGREYNALHGAVLLGMIVTTFYSGKELDAFIKMLKDMGEFRQKYAKEKP
jgi:hypothetical protein